MLNSLVKVAPVVQLGKAPNAARYTQIQSVLDASVRACYPESFVLCTKRLYYIWLFLYFAANVASTKEEINR